MKQLVKCLVGVMVACISLQASAHESILMSRGQTLYVPSYTELYRSSGLRINGLATVTFHNVDLDNSVTIYKVTGYDTAGNIVKQYLEKPVKLAPLESTSFTSRYTSGSDGTGANFTIEWAASTEVVAPLVESKMLASSGTHGYSLRSTARVVKSFESTKDKSL